jgi:hypothetical protein
MKLYQLSLGGSPASIPSSSKLAGIHTATIPNTKLHAILALFTNKYQNMVDIGTYKNTQLAANR